MSEDELKQLKDKMKAGVERSFNELLSPHGMSVQNANVHVLHGDVGALIVHFAKENDVDLLVMGTVAAPASPGC